MKLNQLVVFALYRPHPGKETELRKLIEIHIPTLLRLQLITKRPPILVKSKNGTYIEIFEWRGSECAQKAHEHPEIATLWEEMGKIADFPSLDSLEESKGRFQHFEPADI